MREARREVAATESTDLVAQVRPRHSETRASMSDHGQQSALESNPLEPTTSLLPSSVASPLEALVHPQDVVAPEDSAVTKAEKYERHAATDQFGEPRPKRVKLDLAPKESEDGQPHTGTEHTGGERRKGVAPIKAESVTTSTTVKVSFMLTRM